VINIKESSVIRCLNLLTELISFSAIDNKNLSEKELLEIVKKENSVHTLILK